MEIGWFFSLVVFLWVAAITPGPNNMLLTSTAANFGFNRTLPVLLGIMAGMQVLLLLVSVGIGSLLTLFPSLYFALKILGSAYLLWIAWKIATASYERLNTESKASRVSVYQAGLLQFLNPKAWLMALGAVTTFGLPERYVVAICVISGALMAINFIAGLIWMGFGAVIGSLLSSRRAWFIFNISMGLLTAGCVIFIWR